MRKHCEACGGTGRVLDGEICKWCVGNGLDFGILRDAIDTLEAQGYSDMAEAILLLCERLYCAPVAIMDTRDVLSICAPDEDGFSELYALQGKRVRLVVDDPPNAS